jgi:proliferating cell nuclear antigen
MDCSEEEIAIQSMDSAHVSLVAVSLQSSAFDHYRCDRPVSLGFNSANLSKILKCAGNDDIITIKSDEDADSMTLMFESPSQDRIADFGTSLIWLVVGFVCVSLLYSLLTLAFHLSRT